MKSTGIVRLVDGLGRVVIPKEIRRNLDLNNGEPVEFFVEGDQLVIKRFHISCAVCGNAESEEVLPFSGKLICRDCIDALFKLLNEGGRQHAGIAGDAAARD